MNNIVFQPKYRGKVILYVFSKFILAGVALLPPYCYMLLLDEVIVKQRFDMMIIIIGAYVSIYMVKTAVQVWNTRFYNWIFPEIELDYKTRLMKKYSELDISSLQNFTAGELQKRILKDTENICQYCLKKIDGGIAVISLLMYMGILLYLNWVMALISFLLLPLSIWITRYIKGKSNVEYEKKRQLQGKYNDFMINTMFFWKEIKSNRLEGRQQKLFDAHWEAIGAAFVKAHLFWFMNRSFIAFKDVFLTKMGLYLLGGVLVIYKVASVPVLLTFMEYYSNFVELLLQAADIFVKLGEQEESLRRVNEILRLPIPYRPVDFDFFESLQIMGVGFSYPDKKVLNDFNLNIKRGDIIAVVGESGSGKSTFVKIMAGLLEPQIGQVLWNGYKMENICRNAFYEKVGFIMQDSRLFNLSIRENLQFGKQNVSELEMLEACRRANILGYIQELPQGFETLVGENGIRLSGGQKQRFQIARMLLKDPEVLVFDEATSALDYENEREILDILLKNMKNKTFLMVTHRENTVAKCERVVRIINNS